MRWTSRPLMGLVVVVLLVGACGGGGDSIAGTYTCKAPEEPPDVAQTTELREDGTLTVTPVAGPPEEGTWSVEGETVTFRLPNEVGEFTIEGERLVAEGRGFVCTPEG